MYSIPKVIHGESCIGCNRCVSVCPGQAIFLVNSVYSPDFSAVRIPYELLPLPKKGDVGFGLDRRGKNVCQVIVENVQSAKMFDHTNVLTLVVPKGMENTVRGYKPKEEANNN